jgi:hypothetical protein
MKMDSEQFQNVANVVAFYEKKRLNNIQPIQMYKGMWFATFT